MIQLLDVVNKFPNINLLIIGDLMLDEYIFGSVNRISPEAPIPILDVEKISYIPGGTANVAHNAAVLAHKVFLAGIIGPDERGKILKEKLIQKRIDIGGIIIDNSRETTLKTRLIAKNQQIVRVDREKRNPISPEIESKIINFVEGKIKEVNAIILSDYNKGVLSPNLCLGIINIANQNNIFCLVDPKGKDYSKYRGCNIITPNEKELAEALDIQINERNFSEAGKMLLSHVMCENVIVKRGEKGMTLIKREGTLINCPAKNNKPRDVSGAGDTAVVNFALSLAAGSTLEQALMIASQACGIVVGKMGTSVVFLDELRQNLKNVQEI